MRLESFRSAVGICGRMQPSAHRGSGVGLQSSGVDSSSLSLRLPPCNGSVVAEICALYGSLHSYTSGSDRYTENGLLTSRISLLPTWSVAAVRAIQHNAKRLRSRACGVDRCSENVRCAERISPHTPWSITVPGGEIWVWLVVKNWGRRAVKIWVPQTGILQSVRRNATELVGAALQSRWWRPAPWRKAADELIWPLPPCRISAFIPTSHMWRKALGCVQSVRSHMRRSKRLRQITSGGWLHIENGNRADRISSDPPCRSADPKAICDNAKPLQSHTSGGHLFRKNAVLRSLRIRDTLCTASVIEVAA